MLNFGKTLNQCSQNINYETCLILDIFTLYNKLESCIVHKGGTIQDSRLK